MARNSYTVIFEHGDRPNQWLASVKEVPGCHTFGRGLKQTRERVREALELWEGRLPKDTAIQEVFPLPKAVQRGLSELSRLTRELQRLRELQQEVARELRNRGWSARDVGSVMNVSHQRVSQVARLPKRHSRRRVPKRTAMTRR